MLLGKLVSKLKTEAPFKLSLVSEVFRKRIRVAHARADDQDLEPARARREVLGGHAFELRGVPRRVEQDEPAARHADDGAAVPVEDESLLSPQISRRRSSRSFRVVRHLWYS